MSDKYPPRSMVILKSEAHGLMATEAFLKNREWQLFVTADLKEAVTYAMEHKPSYFFISVDQNNSKIEMLPKILRQSMSVTIIAFSEKNTPNTTIALADFVADYKIPAPMTGPAVERCVQKHHRDLEKANAESSSTKGHGLLRQDDEIHIKSGPKGESEVQIQKGLRGDSHLAKPSEIQTKASAIIEKPETGNIKTRNFNNPTARLETKAGSGADSNSKLKAISTLNPDRMFKEITKQLLCELPKLQKNLPTEVRMSIIDANAACIVIESLRFSGYLVVTQANKQPPTKKFISLFKDKLAALLAAKTPSIENALSHEVQLHDVEFHQWAQQAANFIESSVYNGMGISIAFFPRHPARVPIEKSEFSDMARVKIDDIAGDSVVNFNLYIFLKYNQKMILCTSKGGVFSAKQRTRFIEQGQTHLHVRNEELEELSKYYAQTYLNSLIDESQNIKSA